MSKSDHLPVCNCCSGGLDMRQSQTYALPISAPFSSPASPGHWTDSHSWSWSGDNHIVESKLRCITMSSGEHGMDTYRGGAASVACSLCLTAMYGSRGTVDWRLPAPSVLACQVIFQKSRRCFQQSRVKVTLQWKMIKKSEFHFCLKKNPQKTNNRLDYDYALIFTSEQYIQWKSVWMKR